MSELKSTGKPFDISKWEVWEAWERVKVNKGGPGVDGVTIEDFETDLRNNLYKIWNRMSSGTYFPPPVKAVEIPKQHSGGVEDPWGSLRRATGWPRRWWPRIWRSGSNLCSILTPTATGRGSLPWTRWAMPATVLEEGLGDRLRCPEVLRFRPVGPHRQGCGGPRRCSVGDAVRQAVAAAPMQQADGTLPQRTRGTPQGSSVSPVLANLFLHYAFDMWMVREFPAVEFERYADDGVVALPSPSGRPARSWRRCGNGWRRSGWRCTRPRPGSCTARTGTGANRRRHRSSRSWGSRFARARPGHGTARTFMSFLPAISKEALNKISGEIRSWRLHRRIGSTFAQLAKTINPIVRAGCGTTARSIAPRCIPSWRASTPT